MDSTTISSILKQRGAWLKSTHGEPSIALANGALTRKIAVNYVLFENARDQLFRATEEYVRRVPISPMAFTDAQAALVEACEAHGMVIREPGGQLVCDTKSRRYLSGGWLEELAWLAAMEAGADEAVFGQVIGWEVKGFSGENEIDLIVRKGERLGFVSCKALRSMLDVQDKKLRNRLMEAVNEADNIEDHFGRPGEKVAVLVTTDLFDEEKDAPRYNALMGKAAVLDVIIIPLEDLGWDRLVQAMANLWEPGA